MNNTRRLALSAMMLASAAIVLLGLRTAPTQAGGKGNPQKLVGQPAPDFRPDFALHGKPVRPSDFKGQVVVVHFWAVWCGPCVTTFGYLSRWHEKYHDQGLETMSVTYYNFEIGSKLKWGFDKTAGKLKEISEATAESEREMLTDFAAHHKMNTLVVVLPRDEAVQALTDYHVTAVPHLVVIDRQGIVRMVRVGSEEANARAMEEEIVKLLAEKKK